MQQERFLITGAAGFVGACLTRRLVRSNAEVHIIVRPQSDLWRLNDIKSTVMLHAGDLTDKDFVVNAVRKVQPTVIFHLAAHGAYHVYNDAQRIMATNMTGSLHLLQALEDVPYQLFVNTGSSSEYGFKHQAMSEQDLLEPNSYYAVAKAAQTTLCQFIARSQKKPIVTLRLFSVYGPYEEPTRLVPTLIRRCLHKEDLLMASKNNVRDFVYIDDVVDAYCAFDRLKECGSQVINIGTGIQTSLEDVAQTVLAVTKAKVDVKWNVVQDRIWDTSVWVADVKKAKTLLNWQAKTSFEQGIVQTLAWSLKSRENS